MTTDKESQKTTQVKSGAQQKRRRFQGVRFSLLVPNMITVAATCAALTGIRLSLEGELRLAVAAVLVAAILDGLDGRMARLLNAESDFGAQMDSLSDVVSFGVAPAMIIYFWILHDLPAGLGWMAALFCVVCCALRLARFNSRLTSMPSYAYNFFQGIPAPAGAILILLPLILTFVLEDRLESSIALPSSAVALWAFVMGALMISELPTFSMKKVKIPRGLIIPLMALAGIALAGMATMPWLVLFILAMIYLATLPYSILSYQKLKRAATKPISRNRY